MTKEERIAWLEQYNCTETDFVIIKTACGSALYKISSFLSGTLSHPGSPVGMLRIENNKPTILEPRPKPRAEEHRFYIIADLMCDHYGKAGLPEFIYALDLRNWLREQIEKGKI